MNQTPWLADALQAAYFAYPVAFYDDHDPDLGPNFAADAFEVPEAECVPVSLALTKLVRSCSPALGRPVLSGAFDETESAEVRRRLPASAAWWMPSGWPVLAKTYATIQAALTSAGFLYRVAMFPNHLPELGDVVEVHAFDVPEAKLLDVSQALNALLVALRLHPMAIGMAFYEGESERTASRVPADAVWMLPKSPAVR